MACWQVQAKFPGGMQISFGVEAAEESHAILAAMQILAPLPAAAEVMPEVTRILPPPER